MATVEDIKNEARSSWEAAAAKRDADLAAAGTPAEARRVMDNLEKALAAYVDAITASFNSNDAAWTGLLDDARAARAQIDKARKNAMKFATILNRLEEGTAAVATLINAAKAV